MGSGDTETEVGERLKLGQGDEHGDDSGPEKEEFLDAKAHDDDEEDSSGSSSSGDGDDGEEDEEDAEEDDEEGEDSHGSPNREENGQFAEQNGDGKSLELPEKSNQMDYEEAPNHDNISEGDDRPLATNMIDKTLTPSRKPGVRTSYEFSGLAGPNSAKKQKMIEDDETGTIEEQAEFMRELEIFHKERNLDFKPPKFYQEPLNLLKLWRAVIRLGGYDRVTGQKLWRQVGESFHPPKTCTTVSWTFRIFYEKALLEYEKYKREIGELDFPDMPLIEPTSVEIEGGGYQNSGSGRARRESATRAMQGWHVQRLIGFGEVGEPIIKDKNLSAAQRREKNLKSIGGSKQKRTSAQEPAENHFHDRESISSVVDVGPPADWVKINVRESKDCFEVYALVPGLLREEVRVQSDPAGRLVISGQPEQPDNPWGITPFRKIISLPARINPLQTSAIVSLHGRLYVRVPFDRSNT